MSIDSDLRVDRQRLKRRLTFWRLLAVVAAVGAVLLLIDRHQPILHAQHIARISINGVIADDPDRADALKQVAKDPSARALIVRIDSPGGTVVGGQSLYYELREVAANKPVAIVMGEMATSAGYMVALGGDRIFAREGSVTGSIGVILQTADVTGLLQKLGITTEALKSAPLKAVPSPLEPLTPEAREATMSVIRDVYDSFVKLVETRRQLSPEQAAPLSDGRVFTGRQALANGLIDEIGGENEALRWLSVAHGVSPQLPIRDIDTDEEKELFRKVVGGWAGKTLFSERLTLDGVISVWHPDLR